MLWLFTFGGAVGGGVVVIVLSVRTLLRSAKSLRGAVGECARRLEKQAAFFSSLGTATEWSRPDAGSA